VAITEEAVKQALAMLKLPDGRDIVSADVIRALSIDGGSVRFVLEVPPKLGPHLEPVRKAAEKIVEDLDGVDNARVLLTAHSELPKTPPKKAPPDLRIGGHPHPAANRAPIAGVKRIIAIASGKGGVGKSTVSSNLAVALARAGVRVGLLDADIYGPSQPRMMGVSARPASPDGKTIIPLKSHGVTMMSIGLMLEEDQAVVWRGPMLMGALQQMLGQVQWGVLDVLLVDLPPGTGDVQLTLSQKAEVTGAIVVSTPQDIALLDVRKALDMFAKTGVPIIGMIENMSTFCCPKCGHEEPLFGHGGARAEAARLGIGFLGEIPLSLDIRVAGDSGKPIALTDRPPGQAYAVITQDLIAKGLV